MLKNPVINYNAQSAVCQDCQTQHSNTTLVLLNKHTESSALSPSVIRNLLEEICNNWNAIQRQCLKKKEKKIDNNSKQSEFISKSNNASVSKNSCSK
ncbi:hypothetical protein AB837_00484 [bacterium AB1]|nr:hypothetical protein AB837_00484 [bacterium AB1]